MHETVGSSSVASTTELSSMGSSKESEDNKEEADDWDSRWLLWVVEVRVELDVVVDTELIL